MPYDEIARILKPISDDPGVVLSAIYLLTGCAENDDVRRRPSEPVPGRFLLKPRAGMIPDTLAASGASLWSRGGEAGGGSAAVR